MPIQRFGDGGTLVANNGAAGMLNFSDTGYGALTRISLRPSLHRPLYGSQLHGIFVKALLIHYDTRFWLESFLLNWPEVRPPGNPTSKGLPKGPDYTIKSAAALHTRTTDWTPS